MVVRTAFGDDIMVGGVAAFITPSSRAGFELAPAPAARLHTRTRRLWQRMAVAAMRCRDR